MILDIPLPVIYKKAVKFFKMYVIVDISSSFNSTSRTQMTYKWLINTNISALTYSSSGVCSLASPTSDTSSSVQIPYKVRLNSDGLATDIDMDGSATGDGWITITAIDAVAFKNKTSLVSISNNGSLQTIGDDAFAACTNLSTVNFDFTKIQSVGSNTITQSNAFSDTAFYTSITPDANGLKKAGGIVLGCSTTSQSTTVTSCRLVAPYAFKGQTSLTSVTIASDVQKVTSNAFMSSSSVRMVDITACASTSFEDNAFANNNSIPITLKYASGSTLVNTLDDVTLFNYSATINYVKAVTDSTTLVNLQYSILLNLQTGSESFILDSYGVTDVIESFKFTNACDFAFASSFAPIISVNFNLTQSYYLNQEYWIESISCYHVNSGTNTVIF